MSIKYTYEIKEITLSANDNKTIIRADGINTLAYGNKSI